MTEEDKKTLSILLIVAFLLGVALFLEFIGPAPLPSLNIVPVR